MRIAMTAALMTLVFLSSASALAQEHPPKGQPEDEQPEEGQNSSLMLARGAGPRIEFQIGVDALPGLAGAKFVGGVNGTLVYPIIDMVWVGIRPALHYVMHEDSLYDATWMHADAAVHVNFMHEPVRLYLLAAGGYSFALDTDFYAGVAHGFSVAGGVGVSWKREGPLGLFAELGFRYGSAKHDRTQLQLDGAGQPQYDDESLMWMTETVEHQFELIALTINIGLTISP